MGLPRRRSGVRCTCSSRGLRVGVRRPHGWHETRMHGIGPDAIGTILHGRRLGKDTHRALGGMIGRMAAFPTDKAHNGRDIDDRAPPALCMAGMAYLVPRKTPVALTSIMRRQPSVSIGSDTEVLLSPALFTRVSSLPKRDTAACTTWRQSSSLVTSVCTNRVSA